MKVNGNKPRSREGRSCGIGTGSTGTIWGMGVPKLLESTKPKKKSFACKSGHHINAGKKTICSGKIFLGKGRGHIPCECGCHTGPEMDPKL